MIFPWALLGATNYGYKDLQWYVTVYVYKTGSIIFPRLHMVSNIAVTNHGPFCISYCFVSFRLSRNKEARHYGTVANKK